MSDFVKSVMTKCDHMSYGQTKENIESLQGFTSSDEHGAMIANSVRLILKNKEVIAEQQKLKKPDARLVARANENIKNCIETIKIRMKRLGASDTLVERVISYVEKGDTQNVTLLVLEQMAHRNPGLNQHKYKQALAIVAGRQK